MKRCKMEQSAEQLPLSLFANDIWASWIGTPKCTRCGNMFVRSGSANRYPCNLSCGHIICSMCLTSLRKSRKDAKCVKCFSKLQEKDMSGPIQSEYDFYIMGFANYLRNTVPYLLKNGSPVPELKKPCTTQSSCIECSMSTNFICVQCGSPYCQNCFFKAHSVGVLFKVHEIQPMGTIPSRIFSEFGRCKIHSKEVTHYCKNCSLAICLNCVSTSHSKHESAALESINKKVDLDQSLKFLKNVRQMIEKAKTSTSACINKLDEYAMSTVQDIFTTFQVYHSLLQQLEHAAHIALKQSALKTLEEIHVVQDSIETSGFQIDAIIHRIAQFKNKTPDNVNLLTLNKDIMSWLETTPIDFNFEQFDKNMFSFNVNYFKTTSDLKDLCKLKFDDEHFNVKTTTFYTSKRSTMIHEASSISSISAGVSAQLSTNKTETHKKSTGLIQSRQVTITQITDPKTFHVQNIDFVEREMIKQCNQFAMENKTSIVDISTVLVDEMYLVFENNKSRWYRGLVIKTKQKTVDVYLVDYGRQITVTINQIRQISKDLKKMPRAASIFTIANIEPVDGKWSDESQEMIRQMALTNSATLVYFEENTGDCIIHLEYPTSVEDTLLYHKYAEPQKTTNEAVNQLNKQLQREKKRVMEDLSRPIPFKKQQIGEEFFAKVTYIVSPAQFYITPVDRVDEIRALFEKMQQFYEKPDCQKIFYPHLQMSCCICHDDNWYRARIVAHHPNCVVEVYLVDIGRNVKVDWRYLRALNDTFKNFNEGVTLCSLVDIVPQNYRTWEPAATNELKRLCKNNLKVIVCGTKSRSVEIELYMVKRTVDFQVNAYLAKNNFVQWVGDRELVVERPSDNSPSTNEANTSALMREASQREFRQTIKILHIDSPEKFYVTLLKYENAIKQMHAEIQHTMKSHLPSKEAIEWNVGVYCLVNTQLSADSKKNWYRGRIESVNDDGNFTVFLRDHGKVVAATPSDLSKISPTFGIVIDGASKCQLANVRPTSSTWGKASIDEFRHMVMSGEEYDIFSASVYGEVAGDSLPVYLWGRKAPARQDPLIGAPLTWTNLNEVFASNGYADCLEQFKTIVDCNAVDVQVLHKDMTDFNLWYEKGQSRGTPDIIVDNHNNVLCEDDDFVLAAELDVEVENFALKKVKSWVPAEPPTHYYFHAIPTYVDNNAVIYLHEETKSNYLKQMIFAINKVVDKNNYDKSYKWKEGEPCLVQYHLDKFFYRGVVQEVLPNQTFKIIFVDYGNVESCEASELRPANVLADVPIQATKYYLAYVKPASEDGIWDRKILEFIHSKIVNKTVYVRIEENPDQEYVPITLKVGSMDLGSTLVAEKLADIATDLNVRLTLPETYDFYSENPKSVKRDVDLYKESSVPLDEFKQTIAKRNKLKANKEFLRKYDISDSIDFFVEDSDAETLRNFGSVSKDFEENFQPHDASTTISTAVRSFSLLPFEPLKLSKEITKFPCKVYEVLDSLHLYLEPLIEEHAANIEAMEETLKSPHNKIGKDYNDRFSRVCLAPYSMDKCYYRAVVIDTLSVDLVRVRFVDYLNEEIVESAFLRECPPDIERVPMKHLLVKLHGVKPSRRVRECDIKRQLFTLYGKNAMAFLVKKGDVPSVRLYEKENPSALLYKSLIDLKFFDETKD